MFGVVAGAFSGAIIQNKKPLAAKADASANTEDAIFVSQIDGWTSGNRHSGINFTLDAGSKVTPNANTVIVIDYENLATTDTYVSFYLNGMDVGPNRINSTSLEPKGKVHLFNNANHVQTYEVTTGTADINVMHTRIGKYNKMAIKISDFNLQYTPGVEMNLSTLFFGTRLNLANTDRTKSDVKGFVKGMYIAEYSGGSTLDLSSAAKIYTPQTDNFVLRSGSNDVTEKYLALNGAYTAAASFDISGDGNGTLEFEGSAYEGHEVNLLIRPNQYYIFSSLIINDVDVTESVSNNKILVGPLSASGFVATATFELYTAVYFAQDFLAQTGPICSASENNLSALKLVWPDLSSKYANLNADEKANLVDLEFVDEDVINAIARYNFICGKYNTQVNENLAEFIEGVTIVHGTNPFTLFENENASRTPMITILIVLLIAGYVISTIVYRKRYKNITK